MPCRRGAAAAPASSGPLVDWAQLHPYTPAGVYRPSSLGELVAAVRDVEARGARGKAEGSRFSLSRAPESDGFVIDTSRLDRHLSQPFPAPPVGRLTRLASPAHDGAWLARIAARRPPAGRFLVHVEAGIKIHRLLDDLAAVGLTLPTMGAGGAQSLAGAISTATHGADIDLPPLQDSVRAVHLVAPDGREWWIEPSGGLSNPFLPSDQPRWCADARVARDSDFLNAATVGVGRLGVVYSLVLEVVAQYRLEERADEVSWPEMRRRLLQAIGGGSYTASGNLFADPLAGRPLRFFRLVVDLASRRRAWRTRRWTTADPTDHEVPGEAGLDPVSLFCRNPQAIAGLLLAFQPALQALVAPLLAVPIVGPILAAEYLALIAVLGTAALTSDTIGEAFSKVIDAAKDLGLGWLVEEINGAVIGGAHPELRRGPAHVGGGVAGILDTHDYAREGCFSVNSVEVFFDAHRPDFVTFIDEVLALAGELYPMTGLLSLRFVAGSRAKLAMQGWRRTVAIEIAVPRPGGDNARFFDGVLAAARRHGARPHWGQQHDADEATVEALYGRALDDWRWALAETEVPRRGTFSSEFTRRRGLEPIEPLQVHRSRRYVAATVASTAC